jgi:hypothetical protein
MRKVWEDTVAVLYSAVYAVSQVKKLLAHAKASKGGGCLAGFMERPPVNFGVWILGDQVLPELKNM